MIEDFEISRRRYVFDSKYIGLYEVEVFNSTTGHVFARIVGQHRLMMLGCLGGEPRTALEMYIDKHPSNTLIGIV